MTRQTSRSRTAAMAAPRLHHQVDLTNHIHEVHSDGHDSVVRTDRLHRPRAYVSHCGAYGRGCFDSTRVTLES